MGVPGQKLRGFVGQSMSGKRKAKTPVAKFYVRGSSTFTPTVSGQYRFVLWGGGAGANNGTGSGASGALVVAIRNLVAGQPVAIVVGAGGTNAGGNGGDTTATLPTGEVLTAGGGQGLTGGTATGKASLGDILTNGANGTAGAGAGLSGGSSPSTTDYQGATSATQSNSGVPGAGGATDAGVGIYGGYGLAIITQVRLRP